MSLAIYMPLHACRCKSTIIKEIQVEMLFFITDFQRKLEAECLTSFFKTYMVPIVKPGGSKKYFRKPINTGGERGLFGRENLN